MKRPHLKNKFICIQNTTKNNLKQQNNEIYSKYPPFAAMQASKRFGKSSTVLIRVSKVISFHAFFSAFFNDSKFGCGFEHAFSSRIDQME